MRLKKIKIQNFKSLEKIEFCPNHRSIIIGPNNSGKTNFANALRFLSEVYSFGLETAIRRNGGYENIALRRKRRSRSAITFDTLIQYSIAEVIQHDINLGYILFAKNAIPGSAELKDSSIFVNHSFSFQATGQNIKSEYKITHEFFSIYFKNDTQKSVVISLERHENKVTDYTVNGNYIQDGFYRDLFAQIPVNSIITSSQSLLISSSIFSEVSPLSRVIQSWAIYQFNPAYARLEGVPTPNPQLDTFGQNLPAIVDWFMSRKKGAWKIILSTIKEIIPDLEDITINYLHNKTLGIFFSEKGFGRPWSMNEVSDGTILTLSILCSVMDPRKTLVLLEEPENSVHPWIIRTIMDFLKEASKSKDIIVTTHSPVLIDLVHPSDIWVISRHDGLSTLNKLIEIDDEVLSGWENGDYKISQYLDSGLIPNVIP